MVDNIVDYNKILCIIVKNWIKPIDENSDSRKKEYIITNLGKDAVENEIIRLEELIINGKKITGGI